jgi:flavin-dependent dehydrogenase
MLNALVAGAGPAGSTAALLLARARRSVCIYERSAFPRTKACGEYLSPRTVRLLHALGLGPQLSRHARVVRGVRLHGHGVHARIDFTAPAWSLPRSVLDEALVNAALAAGAKLARGRVENCIDGLECAHVTIRLPDGRVETVQSRAVVAADGMHSIVARTAGLSTPVHAKRERFALGGHYYGFAQLDGYIDMFVDGDTYVAINPLGNDVANVMLVVPARELELHRDAVEAFAEQRVRTLAGTLIDGARLERKRIAIGPLSYRARHIAGRHVVLAGDAACFLDPFTGQGVYLALRCGQIAAQSICSEDLRTYEPRVRREIQSRERSARGVARFIRSPLLARTGAAMLRHAPALLQPLVTAATGAG